MKRPSGAIDLRQIREANRPRRRDRTGQPVAFGSVLRSWWGEHPDRIFVLGAFQNCQATTEAERQTAFLLGPQPRGDGVTHKSTGPDTGYAF